MQTAAILLPEAAEVFGQQKGRRRQTAVRRRGVSTVPPGGNGGGSFWYDEKIRTWRWQMMNVIFLTVVFALLLPVSSTARAQDVLLMRRSGLELNFGVWTGGASTSVSPGGVTTEANLGAFVGGLLYAYWMRENLSVTLSAGLLSANASSSVGIMSVEQQASSVTSLLLGVRFYLPDPESDARVRPFLSGAIGTYIGSEAKSTLFSQEAHSEASFGGRLGGGIDFLLGDHFKLAANAGYNLMSDFSASVGGRENYNGGDFSIGIGYVF